MMSVDRARARRRPEPTRPRILLPKVIPFPSLTGLRRHFRLFRPPPTLPLERAVARHPDLGGMVTLLSQRVDRGLLDRLPYLRVIANYAVGYDNIDLEEATRRGILVANTPGVLTEATADLTWALILAVARRLVEGDGLVRRGKFRGWHPQLLLGVELRGRQIGILGAGQIGQAVGRRALGFGMRVVYWSRGRKPEFEEEVGASFQDLTTLLKSSDIISLHLPLAPETYHLIGRRELGWMKREAILINTARGGLVDEEALIQAVKTRKIGGAGLDVFEQEPRVPLGLRRLPQVVLMPHAGSATRD